MTTDEIIEKALGMGTRGSYKTLDKLKTYQPEVYNTIKDCIRIAKTDAELKVEIVCVNEGDIVFISERDGLYRKLKHTWKDK